MSFYASYPLLSSGGIVDYATFSAFPSAATAGNGALALALDTGTLYESDGANWRAIASPGATLGIGTIDSGTPNANGAQIVSNNLVLQTATTLVPGYVSIGTQSFAGDKTFTGAISASNLSGTNTGDATLGTANGLSLSSQVLSLALSSTSTTGALSSTDWNTFNGKQSAGNYITALTGDVSAAGPGSVAATLATVNGSPGSFGDASHSLSATVNAKGLITSLAANSILIAESQVTNLVSDLAGKQPTGNYITALTGDGAASGPGSATLTLSTVNGSPGSFGDASHSLSATVNAKGLITSLSANSILIAESQVTNLVSDLAGKQPTGNYITALTGDATASGPGSAALTLATVNASAGSFGDASHSLSATVNAKGLITSLSANSIQIAESQVTNLVSDLAGKQATGNYITALTGDVTASGPGSSAATVAKIQGTVVSGTTGSGNVAFSASPTFTGTIAGAALTLSTALTVPNGGTGDQSFTAYAVICGGTTSTGALQSVAALGSSGQVLTSNGAGALPTFQPAGAGSFKAPTQQKFLSGSGTYTTPTSPAPLYIRIRAIGGGGGGGGTGAGAGAGGAGANTSFGTSLISAGGGAGGSAPNTYTAGTGGTASLGTGPIGIALTGGAGGVGSNTSGTQWILGGAGGNGAFGGGGTGGGGSTGTVGIAGATNTGGGGGGAGGGSGANSASGGGSGGFVDALITSSISATYAYVVGGAGTAGAGALGGGAGGSGMIEVLEYYQ